MTIDTSWSGDIAAMAADLPSVLAWNGNTVTGTASHITRTDDIDPTGELTISDFEWVGALSDFSGSTPPQVRDVVAIGGVNYHVADRQVDAAGVSLRLRRV